MALEVNQVKKTEVKQATTPQNQDVAVNSGSGYVDVKQKPQTKENDTSKEIIDFLNSLDKSLSQKEKIKLLKEHFPALKDAKKEQLRDYITLAENSVNKTSATSAEPPSKETSDDPKETTKKTSEQTQYKQNEIEQYAEKIGFKGSIDKLITTLQKQKKRGKLDEEGLKILEQLQTVDKKNNKNKKAVDITPLVTDEELDSPEWKKMSQDEKTDAYMNLYLLRNDKKYAKLSPEEQKVYRQKQVNTLKDLVGLDSSLDSTSNARVFSKYIDILETLNNQQITIDKFLKMKDSQKVQLVNKGKEVNVTNAIITKANQISELVPEETRNSDAWKKLSKEEKLHNYADAYFTKKYPEYSKLSEEEKAEFRNNKTEEIIKFIMGDNNIIDVSNNKDKNDLLKIAAECINLAEKGQLTETKLEEITLSSKLNNRQMKVLNEIRADYPDASLDELLEIVKQDKRLNGSPIRRGKIVSVLEQMRELDPNNKLREIVDYEKIAKQNNFETVDEFITKTVTQKTPKIEIETMAQNLSTEDFTILIEHLRKLGYSEKNIQELGKLRDLKIAVHTNNDDGKQAEAEIYAISNVCKAVYDAVMPRTKSILTGVSAPERFELVKCSANRGDSQYADIINAAKHEALSYEDNLSIMQQLGNSEEVSDANKAIFSESHIKTAPDDEIRVKYSKDLSSSTENPAFLEGLAAGSKYVKDENYKTQYNSYIQTAAQNFPPEVQTTVNTAIKTGKISKETLSKTTPPVVSDNQSSSASKTSSSKSQQSSTAASADKSGRSTTSSSKSTPQTTANNQTSIPTRTSKQLNTPAFTSGATTSAYHPIKQTYQSNTTELNSNTSKDTISNTTTKTSKTTTSVANDSTAALEAKRDAVGEKILNYQEHVKESNIERTLNNYLSANETQVIESVITSKNSNNIPTEIREKFKQIMEQNNINEIYDIITSKFGTTAKEKFIEALARYGSSDSVSSFANDRKNDPDLIKTLYLKCTNQMVKAELLNMLPEDTLHQMISDGVISNLNDIDTKILKSFLRANGSSMSNSKFASYRKYFSLDDWTVILNERNAVRGVKTTQQTQNSKKEDTIEQPQQPDSGQLNAVQDTLQNRKTEKLSNDVPETQFKAGETIKTLSNGTVITNQGTTFAGISNTQDESFKVVEKPQKHQEGSPIGMNDEVLTPGSEEWRLKYNKQQEPPKTAFTMAAMDENDEDFGMPFGSNKVGMSTKINKKFPNKNFRFNA